MAIEGCTVTQEELDLAAYALARAEIGYSPSMFAKLPKSLKSRHYRRAMAALRATGAFVPEAPAPSSGRLLAATRLQLAKADEKLDVWGHKAMR